MSHRNDRRPASTYAGVSVVTPVWINACGRRALSYASTSSNQTQSLVFIVDNAAINLSAKSLRTRLAMRSPPACAQKASNPNSEKAQARGDRNASTAGSAVLNSEAAHLPRDGSVSLRAHSAKAQSVLP